MHFNFGTVLIITAVVCSLYLLIGGSGRLMPSLAVLASCIELLLVFGVMSLQVAKFRIDVILPALLLIAGAICWSRSAEKGSTTASTALTLVGAIQLFLALRIF